MAKPFEKAVTGFNHNIRHKGKQYHVQTEDSGVSNPHIITHLFVGGNILATKKTSYSDVLGASDLPELVRQLMEEQHKEMLRNLIAGVYDDIESANAASAKSYQPGVLDLGGKAPESVGPLASAQTPPRPLTAPAAATAHAAPAPVPAKLPTPTVPLASPNTPPRPLAVPVAPPAAAPVVAPPPAALPRPVTPVRPMVAAAEARPLTPPIPLTLRATAPVPSPFEPRNLPPEVMAARQLTEAPRIREEGAETLFGEDLISEKSLDEVILQYLAGDAS